MSLANSIFLVKGIGAWLLILFLFSLSSAKGGGESSLGHIIIEEGAVLDETVLRIGPTGSSENGVYFLVSDDISHFIGMNVTVIFKQPNNVAATSWRNPPGSVNDYSPDAYLYGEKDIEIKLTEILVENLISYFKRGELIDLNLIDIERVLVSFTAVNLFSRDKTHLSSPNVITSHPYEMTSENFEELFRAALDLYSSTEKSAN
ncbi:MAG: hypothetical protein ACFE0O_14465 [Opitutales bacterium]